MYALKRDFPHLSFSLNGGVQSCQSGAAAMQLAPLEGASLTGVMIGRAAYNAPWACLADADRTVFGQPSNMASSRQQVLHACFQIACAPDLSLFPPDLCPNGLRVFQQPFPANVRAPASRPLPLERSGHCDWATHGQISTAAAAPSQ